MIWMSEEYDMKLNGRNKRGEEGGAGGVQYVEVRMKRNGCSGSNADQFKSHTNTVVAAVAVFVSVFSFQSETGYFHRLYTEQNRRK
jgi:hypothetical protein